MSAPRVRKNIDKLPPAELDAYKHAVQKLKDISAADPENKNGYSYLASLHDSILRGPCEHGRDTFFAWHRAHLLLYENALRESDPAVTADVTVPYWDWSALPSGSRYPSAFEEVGSPLRAGGRRSTPICKPGSAAGCNRLPFPRSYLDQSVLSTTQWAGSTGFAGVHEGEANCTEHIRNGFGLFESPAHNDMHRRYVGGLMAIPDSAAEDPIFWSFHCYIDLLWWQWQQMPGRTVDTCLDCRLCGLWKDATERYRVRDVLDPAALGYEYKYEPGPEPEDIVREARAEDLPFDVFPAVDFVPSGEKDPEFVGTLDITVPKPGFKEAHLWFRGVKLGNPFSYGGDVYLMPKSEPFAPRELGFREKYLAGLYSIWKAHSHAGDPGHGHRHAPGRETEMDLVVNITGPLAQLAERRAGEDWVATIAVVADASDDDVKTLSTARGGTREDAVRPFLEFRHVELDVR